MNDFFSFSIVLLGVFSFSESKVCYVVDNSPFKVSCNLNETRTYSVVWKATVNQTRVNLVHCTRDGCTTEFGYARYFQASSAWDITDSWIVNSNLETPVGFSVPRNYNSSKTFFSSFTNIACEGSITEKVVCEKIEVYVNPQVIMCNAEDVDTTTIFISCTVYTAYPQLLFDLSLKFENQTLSITPNLSQSCETSQDFNDSSLYAMLCTLNIPLSNLGPGINEVSIETSTNITDPARVKVKSNTMSILLNENLQNFNCSVVDFNMEMRCRIPFSYTEINSTITLKSNLSDSAEYVKQYYRVDPIISSTDGLIIPMLKFGFRLKPDELKGKQEYSVTMTTVNRSGITTELSTPWAEIDFYYPTWMNFTLNGTSSDLIVNAGDTVEIVCSMNGYPEPQYEVDYNPYFEFEIEIQHRRLMTIRSFYNTGYLICKYMSLYSKMKRRINLLVRSVICSNVRPTGCPDEDFVMRNFVGNSITFPVYGYPQPETMILVNKSYSGDIVMSENVSIVYEADRPFSGTITVTLLNEGVVHAKTTQFHLLINNGVGNGSILILDMEGKLPWKDETSSSADTNDRFIIIFLLALLLSYEIASKIVC